jgi:hypothetical protein
MPYWTATSLLRKHKPMTKMRLMFDQWKFCIKLKKITSNGVHPNILWQHYLITIGLIHIAKIRLPEIWQRMIFLVFSVYMAKAIRNLSGFNKKNLVFLIRNISSKELHSALGKISVVNLMYNLLGLKNCLGLKI